MKKSSFILALLVSTAATGFAQQTPKVLLREEGVENAYPRLSSDGQTLLYQSNKTGSWQLYLLDTQTSRSRQLTSGKDNNNLADLSPDNKWVSFVSDRDGNEEIYMMQVNGQGLMRLTNDPGRDIHPYFSPDGKCLLFNSTRGNGSLDIYRYILATGKIERLTNTPEDETCARYNKEMTSIVYLKNSAVQDDVFTMEVPRGVVSNVSRTPGTPDGWPVFGRKDGRIYYSSMESGTYAIYRIRPNGKGKEQLTHPAADEEDARAFIAAGGRVMVFNRKKGKTISILSLVLSEV